MNPTSQFEQADRVWRKTWLKDLNLSAKDQSYNIYENPEYYKATNNIFRYINSKGTIKYSETLNIYFS